MIKYVLPRQARFGIIAREAELFAVAGPAEVVVYRPGRDKIFAVKL